MLTIKRNQTQELRLKLYHELEAVYHRFFDELAQADLPDGELGKLVQVILLSRQEGLKHLLSDDEKTIDFLRKSG